MINRLMLALASALLTVNCVAEEASASQSEENRPQVIIHTSQGDMRLELYPEKAPATVENFLQYARSGFYDGTIFHRVISYFMIQGGGFTEDMQKKATREPVQNEADNGLKNVRGSIAMARTGNPHSATAQFFINVQDNVALDHTSKASSRTWGYAVFGKVLEGLNVMDDIRFIETASKGPYQDVPVKPVLIESVDIID